MRYSRMEEGAKINSLGWREEKKKKPYMNNRKGARRPKQCRTEEFGP